MSDASTQLINRLFATKTQQVTGDVRWSTVMLTTEAKLKIDSSISHFKIRHLVVEYAGETDKEQKK